MHARLRERMQYQASLTIIVKELLTIFSAWQPGFFKAKLREFWELFA